MNFRLSRKKSSTVATARRLSRKKYSTVAAARTALRAVRDSSHAFPPLQSAAAALLIVWDMSEKIKSNKEDCKRLAGRATKIVGDIWRQTKDYGVRLPTEVQESVEETEKIICNVVDLMKDLEKQNLIRRYARQDENRSRVEEQTRLLDEAIQRFGWKLEISVFRLQMELDGASRERHDEILVHSRMSDRERELLAKILNYARGNFFFV